MSRAYSPDQAAATAAHPAPFTLATTGTATLTSATAVLQTAAEMAPASDIELSLSRLCLSSLLPPTRGSSRRSSVSSGSLPDDTLLVTPYGSPRLRLADLVPGSPSSYNSEYTAYTATSTASSTASLAPATNPAPLLAGDGLYALVGARVWLPPHEMRAIVDLVPSTTTDAAAGANAFSPSAEEGLARALQTEIERYGPEMWVKGPPPHDAPAGHTPASHALASSPLRGAHFLHVANSPADVLALVAEMEAAGGYWRPRIAFEPVPAACHPGEKDAFERTAQAVDILSPNHEELLAFYGLPAPQERCDVRAAVAAVAQHLLQTIGVGPGGDGVLVVRCGPHGGCVGTRARGLCWTPSYFAASSLRVKDTTGAGSAFIGGYIAGLKLTGGDVYEAALYASVSSSFVVEQYGPPSLTAPCTLSPPLTQSPIQHALDLQPPHFAAVQDLLSPSALNVTRAHHLSAAKGREMWNSDSPQRRLELLRARAAAYA